MFIRSDDIRAAPRPRGSTCRMLVASGKVRCGTPASRPSTTRLETGRTCLCCPTAPSSDERSGPDHVSARRRARSFFGCETGPRAAVPGPAAIPPSESRLTR
jgi:hypothetical protein